MICSIMNKRLILLYYSAIQKPTIKTCSIERQIPQWLSHDLSHPGSSPTTLTVRHKELRMGGDGCVSPPASCCLSQLQYGVEIHLHSTKNKRMKLTKDKKKLNINGCKITSLMSIAEAMTHLSGSSPERRGSQPRANNGNGNSHHV